MVGVVGLVEGFVGGEHAVSIGVADLAEDCASVQVLLNRADAQLYRAKKAGRHRVMAAFIP